MTSFLRQTQNDSFLPGSQDIRGLKKCFVSPGGPKFSPPPPRPPAAPTPRLTSACCPAGTAACWRVLGAGAAGQVGSGSLPAPAPGHSCMWPLAEYEFDSQRSSPASSGMRPHPPPSPQWEGLSTRQRKNQPFPEHRWELVSFSASPPGSPRCPHLLSLPTSRVSRPRVSLEGAVGSLQGLWIQNSGGANT